MRVELELDVPVSLGNGAKTRGRTGHSGSHRGRSSAGWTQGEIGRGDVSEASVGLDLIHPQDCNWTGGKGVGEPGRRGGDVLAGLPENVSSLEDEVLQPGLLNGGPAKPLRLRNKGPGHIGASLRSLNQNLCGETGHVSPGGFVALRAGI